MFCPLCNHSSVAFFTTKSHQYYCCDFCKGIFMSDDDLPVLSDEKNRYLEHNNDINDVRYQQFVMPIVQQVVDHYTPEHRGLDFGAGTGPVISKLLTDRSYQIVQYDPFFHNYPELLLDKYDYIVACEVIEHFHQPNVEFVRLKEMLKPGGRLICMTTIYHPGIDFKTWYYKNDPTHVFFYHSDTLQFIQKTYGFSELQIFNNLIVLSV